MGNHYGDEQGYQGITDIQLYLGGGSQKQKQGWRCIGHGISGGGELIRLTDELDVEHETKEIENTSTVLSSTGWDVEILCIWSFLFLITITGKKGIKIMFKKHSVWERKALVQKLLLLNTRIAQCLTLII